MWRKRTSSLSFLVLIPLLFSIIWCASQMGLSFSRPSVLDITVDPHITADYRPWEQFQFRQVKPALGTQAAIDQLAETGVGPLTQIAAVPTATAIAQATTPTVSPLPPTVVTLSPEEATQAVLNATPPTTNPQTPAASATTAAPELPTATPTLTLTLTSTLTATSSSTPTTTATATTTIPRPSANFSASPISGSAPLLVTFLNYSSGNITSYVWNFGDGATSNQISPTHTYASAGTYPVSLTVTGPGGTASATINIFVTVAPMPPVASFVASPTTGYTPLAVMFTNTSLGSITTYAWNFGDGGSSNQPTTTHTYTSAGTYTVSLTVTGPGGTHTANTTITVNPVPAAPVASFTANPTTGNAPLNVTFTNTSTGTITTYAWNFGDGATSAQANPAHTYASAGTYTASLTVTGPGGTNATTRTITVNAAPVASFTANPTTGNAPLNVNFTNTSTGSITTYAWNFGDGATSNLQNPPAHTYASVGTYTVALTVTGPGGNNTTTRTITVTTAPVASFTANPTTGAMPLNVTFTNTSTGTITAYAWNFGDGATSNLQNPPAHSYASAGTYTVSLQVTGPGGSNNATQAIIVIAPPVAGFTANPTTGVAPLNVIFTNTSTGSITSYAWNFGDGSTSTQANPTHNYANPGTYTVSLQVTGPGGTSSTTMTITVTAAPVPPVASFTANPTTGNPPLNVTFTNTSTGTITGYSWNFGDGSTDTQANPTHTYNVAGTYTVSLQVTGPAGSNTTTGTIIVTPLPTAPVAGFTANPTTGAPPLNVTFTDTSTGTITNWDWAFGDGATSNQQNPTHSYGSVGVYTVMLTVTGPDGSTNFSTTINVVAAPVASFIASPTMGAVPLNVTLTNTSTGSITTYAWDFGDGSTSNQPNPPAHTYASAGTYTVTLTVTGPGGTTAANTTITVAAPPVASFTANPTFGAPPLNVIFTDTSTGSITTYAWDFGDGATSNQPSPTHSYASAGMYTVILTVTGPGGSDVASTTVTVVAPPTAGFTANPLTGAPPLNVTLTNTSTGSITTYAWDFGDGATSNQPSPTHSYASAGTYTVTLTVTGPGGSDTSNTTVTVVDPPTAGFTANPLTGAPPLNVIFTDTSTGTITTYAWDFGDGATSNQPSPTHSYASAGTYTVTLTVTGPGGSDTASTTVTVVDPPAAGFTANPLAGAPPLDVTFTNASTGTITTYAWDFGDGATSNQPNPPLHTYASNGTYTVTLVVTGPGGSDTTTAAITVSDTLPNANFTALPAGGLATAFTDTSTGVITAWNWDFGDGATSTLQNPIHTYAAAGTYAVTLTVTGPGGSDAITGSLTITPFPPVVSFTASQTVPLTLAFTDTTIGSVTTWNWDFGDGATSTLQNPTHVYASAGDYSVTLAVNGLYGADSATSTVTVTGGTPLAITIRQESLDDDQQSQFRYFITNTSAAAVSNISLRFYYSPDSPQPGTAYVFDRYFDGSGIATISGPFQASATQFYFVVNYGSASLASGSSWEFQGGMHITGWPHDFSRDNDWWHTGLSDTLEPTTHVPVYINGVLMVGAEP